jgi:hypothetical protein
MQNSNSGFTAQNNTKFNPFQNFDFSTFEKFQIASAKDVFSADDSFGEAAGTFEFVFFSPFSEESFTEFAEFFEKKIAPKVQQGSFLKFNFFFSDFDKQFEFAKFNEFFNQFLKNGSMVEFSFFPSPLSNFTFGDFSPFAGFKFPFAFNNDEFFFRARV